MEQISQRLSAFAEALRFDEIPQETQLQAKRTLLNFFGCACGGASHEAVEAAIRGLGASSGGKSTAVIGRRERFDPGLAALLNGMSSAVYSFDDTHAQALVHPGGPVACSLLSLAQNFPVGGERFLLAFILGVELVCRLSKSVSVPPAKARPEWIQTGICAGVGAAFGGARLLGLSQREIISAIGLAASRSSGFRGLSRSMCFSFMAGSAAESGVRAALLAGAGMTGPEEPLAGEHGFCGVFSADPHPAFLTDGLGETYELAANTFKPYPCGVVIHPVIDASLALANRIEKPEDIVRVVVDVHPTTQKLGDCLNPQDQFEAQVSLQHWTACALLDRAAGIEQTSDSRLSAPDVVALRKLVHVSANPDMRRSSARVAAFLRSGESFEEHVADCRGASLSPLSDPELEEKYMRQAAPRLGEARARRLADACWTIDRLPEASVLLNYATGE